MRTVLLGVLACALSVSASGATIYVNNLTGDDTLDGLSATVAGDSGPVASIERAFALVKTSDRVEIANTGVPYQRSYPGVRGSSLVPAAGGTAEQMLVVNGNAAVMSGLAVIPEDAWTAEDGLLFLPFWPMSNQFKGYTQIDHWLDDTHIWWVDGKLAPNAHSMAELRATPGAFWWDRTNKRVLFHKPGDVPLADLRVEIPANMGIYVHHDYTLVQDLVMMFSWNDGFDIAGAPKGVVFRRCISYHNCGQGFSCHGTGSALYDECAAVNCASSGVCDVDWSNSIYRRCVFLTNTFEAGVYAHMESIHTFQDCLIVRNAPFEQIWQRGNSKMNFQNCVVVGRPGTSLVSLASGSVAFQNCTLLDAEQVAVLPESGGGRITMEHCLVARMNASVLTLPVSALARLSLAGNAYVGVPGHCVADAVYDARNWADLQDTHLEKGSFWPEIALSGELGATPSTPLETVGAGDRTRPVGAKLPEPVWALYAWLQAHQPTPAGLVPVSR